MKPDRGDVWVERRIRQLRGREQQGQRPVIVVSADAINRGPSNLAVVVPLTTRDRGIDLHVAVEPPDGGLHERSFALPEEVHVVAQERLIERWGRLSTAALRQLEDRLRVVLDLS